MWMTTLSCVSTEFGGFLKDSPIVFQTAPECSTELGGMFRTNVPDSQITELRNPVFMRVPRLENEFDLKMTTKKSDIVRNNQK